MMGDMVFPKSNIPGPTKGILYLGYKFFTGQKYRTVEQGPFYVEEPYTINNISMAFLSDVFLRMETCQEIGSCSSVLIINEGMNIIYNDRIIDIVMERADKPNFTFMPKIPYDVVLYWQEPGMIPCENFGIRVDMWYKSGTTKESS